MAQLPGLTWRKFTAAPYFCPKKCHNSEVFKREIACHSKGLGQMDQNHPPRPTNFPTGIVRLDQPTHCFSLSPTFLEGYTGIIRVLDVLSGSHCFPAQVLSSQMQPGNLLKGFTAPSLVTPHHHLAEPCIDQSLTGSCTK